MSGRRGPGGFAMLTVALGAVFLLAASYLTLKQAIIGGGGTSEQLMTSEALGRMSPGELDDAAVATQRSFAQNPLETAAILDLSHIAELKGQAEASERLKLLAGEMRPRAAAVQAEALTILLQRRDFDAVMGRLDGLIRARPDDEEPLFMLAADIAGDEDGSRAVARMLASDPPWRTRFLYTVIGKGQAEAAFRVMTSLRDMGAAVDVSEYRAVIEDHLKRGNVDRAYAVWLSSLSEDELKAVKRVYDGDFTEPVRNLHFDWTVTPADGLAYRLFPRNTASMDQTLQLDFLNFKGPFANLSQILRLRPGRFRLSGEARFENFVSPTGMVFRLYCFGSDSPLDETVPLPQSSQWIDFEKTFQVPPRGCENQLLQLESRTTSQTGQATRGMVAIDTVAIDSLPDLAP